MMGPPKIDGPRVIVPLCPLSMALVPQLGSPPQTGTLKILTTQAVKLDK